MECVTQKKQMKYLRPCKECRELVEREQTHIPPVCFNCKKDRTLSYKFNKDKIYAERMKKAIQVDRILKSLDN